MIQTFGDVIDVINNPPDHQEYIVLEMSFNSAIPFSQRWRNNSLSADFIADYLTTFFPNDLDKQKEIKSTVSYIANELLENAVKFNDDSSIRIRLHLCYDGVIFLVTNSISPQAVAAFQAYIQELMSHDPDELWMQKLTEDSENDNQTSSGLGLLTILIDYQAKLGWTFETLQTDPEVIVVTTFVQLTL
jgi:hypothetical protein